MKPYYQDDWTTIFHGDCREIIPTLEPVDLVIADPPYGIKIMTDYGFGIKGNRAANGKTFEKMVGNDEDFIPTNYMINGAKHCFWGANHYAHNLPHIGRWLVWDKREGIMPQRMQADCEFAWCDEYGAARIFRHYWDGMLKKSEKGIPRQHPTQKPVALMSWCISFYPSSKLILDPFMGSGTTLVAAKLLNRKSIGIEIEEKYCEIAAKRCMQEVFDLTEKGGD